MSWDSYIANMTAPESDGLVLLEEAAICGIVAPESVWASTSNFAMITAAEIKRLASDRKDFGQNGPVIAGTKCRLIRDNMDIEGLFCMDLKTSADEGGNTFNICVGKSIKAIVIAKGKKDTNGGQVSTKVFSIVEYLRKAGY
ncbi:profilin-1 [Scomber scombrus]|uniref:Profilin n=1 Tax=Scomber scombrus TaxID=13677 RepID=A0AAV1QNN0_SCOSC